MYQSPPLPDMLDSSFQRIKSLIKSDFDFKVILLGSQSVGKSTLIASYIQDQFDPNHQVTMGANVYVKQIQTNDYHIVRMSIWDTCGQERHDSLTRGFFQKTDIAILVYDITRQDTLAAIERTWLPQIRENCDENVIILLFGNKSDLQGQRKVSADEAIQLSSREIIEHHEVTATNPQKIFRILQNEAQILINQRKPNLRESNHLNLLNAESIIHNKPQPKKKCSC